MGSTEPPTLPAETPPSSIVIPPARMVKRPPAAPPPPPADAPAGALELNLGVALGATTGGVAAAAPPLDPALGFNAGCDVPAPTGPCDAGAAAVVVPTTVTLLPVTSFMPPWMTT